MKINNVFKLVISVLIVETAGIVGGIFTASSIPTWYAQLAKPALNPPSWVFGPVWTVLYGLMGAAAFLIVKNGWHRKDVRIALGIFAVQLALNVLWSFIFFGQQNPGAAFIEIFFLWLAIAVTIAAFSKISKGAAWLLIPYIAWVSFAAYLNYAIWQLSLSAV